MDMEARCLASASQAAQVGANMRFNAATASGGADGLDAPEAVREFVAGTFFSILLDEMQKTVPENSMFGSTAEGMFREMLNREYASALTRNAPFPLADAAIRQMGLAESEDGLDVRV